MAKKIGFISCKKEFDILVLKLNMKEIDILNIKLLGLETVTTFRL